MDTPLFAKGIHSLNTHPLNAYSMPDTALGNGDEKDPIIDPEMFIVYIPFNVASKQFL